MPATLTLPRPSAQGARTPRAPFPPAVVCGIDVGSLRTPAYVAWLRDGRVVLDQYQPTVRDPLPQPPPGWPTPEWVALDAPQGLPARGTTCRSCDRAANTPTRRLPPDRAAVATSTLYRGLVEAGIALFWAVHEQGLAQVAGVAPAVDRLTTVCETYPRYVLQRLWPDLRPIPSKRQAPLTYVDLVWSRIREAGYTCAGVERPCVDHVDAMLCALAAQAAAAAGGLPPGTVGEPALPDYAAEVLREGFIVSP